MGLHYGARYRFVLGRQRVMRRHRKNPFHLSEPVRGLEESIRIQLRLGCINCLAHAAVDRSSPDALAWADELDTGGPF